ncbi:MAG: hypothetical protein Q7K57_25005 [Burkholderiaceae bacterium]|nr:hypothetical protein [Burkholderiaceae bacterium]
MRFRNLFIIFSLLAVGSGLFLTDPDKGINTGIWLLSVATGVVAVAAAHLSRKGLFDYLDMEVLAKKASEEPTGAGLVFIGVCIVIFGLLGVFGGKAHAEDVRTTIPDRAMRYLPTLKAEQLRFWPSHPAPEQLGALIEHESCLSLTHSRCWSPTSRLKTAREEGAGFGQITRAYRKDGGLRFDALAEMRDTHPALAGWSWDNVYKRPDYQLRAVVLKSQDNFRALRMVADPQERLRFADAGYNGGMGGVQNERRACGLSAGCDPQRWFNHVELHCLKSRSALYGQRSACDINRFHVRDVVLTRSAKYVRYLV